MNFLKRRLEVLRKVCKVRTVIITFSVLAIVLGTSISMADWTGDSTDVYTLGQVGIGNTSNVPFPDQELHIENSGFVYAIIRSLDGGAGLIIDRNNIYRNGDIELFTDGVCKWRVGQMDASYDGINGDEFYIGTAQDDAKLVINPNGNIGIGTLNPVTKFQVEGYHSLFHTRSLQVGNMEFNDNRRGIYVDYGQNTGWSLLKLINDDGVQLSVEDGKVGIGTDIPSYKLDVAGTTSSNLYRCSSDARYKKNVSTYDNTLEKVLGLRGVSYFWKTDEYKERNFSKDKQVGFIAQEVEKVIPELVYTDDKGYKTMSYDRLTAIIVEAIKELKGKNDQKISALEKESAELKQRLAKLDMLAERLAVLEKAVEKQENKRLAKR